ncbi:hypothetical protein IAG44_26260 [Streptomyces roseirectus]|uniref:Uncharacterized protein n=1 Tax=Streptomyces roseirectus TaxID=2768066 RepID=A0A7H0IIG8_9ACTN|nr:DUF6232 family protein [Streptomyces roseirectus]QNP72584.1 hypothetical protein IAG44_26260 [Streptomyces roseirectus]
MTEFDFQHFACRAGVSRGWILWVGAEAYPLHNIARATTVRIRPRRMAALGQFLAYALLLVVVSGVITEAARHGELNNADSGAVTDLVLLLDAVIGGILVIRLVSVLVTPVYHALVIETAGTPYTALVSTDKTIVSRLVFQIMDAIDNPEAEFQVSVENYHIGDKINMVGGHNNIGKQAN